MNLKSATANAVFLLKTQSQWQGFLFNKNTDTKFSCKLGGDSSSSFSSSEDIDNFVLKWFLYEVITLCNFGATAYACIEQSVKYFFPKPLSNFN